MCSRRDTRRTSRAAVFCTRWTFMTSRSIKPNNRELQESNLDVTKAWINFAVESCVKYWRIWPIFLMPNIALLHTLLTCELIFNEESMMTPRFLASGDGWMIAFPILIAGFHFVRFLINLDVKYISSVFPSFSTNQFLWHQERISATHDSIFWTARRRSFGGKVK